MTVKISNMDRQKSWRKKTDAKYILNVHVEVKSFCCCFCSLVGFPVQRGRHEFKNTPSWAEDQCEVIKFEPFIFYPLKTIYVQLSVNHFNYSDASFVHEATTPWVESVNSTQFTACVTRAGRNDYPTDSFATVDWVAYQGAPPGGVAGEETFSRWWTGTTCQTVTLPKVTDLLWLLAVWNHGNAMI